MTLLLVRESGDLCFKPQSSLALFLSKLKLPFFVFPDVGNTDLLAEGREDLVLCSVDDGRKPLYSFPKCVECFLSLEADIPSASQSYHRGQHNIPCSTQGYFALSTSQHVLARLSGH